VPHPLISRRTLLVSSAAALACGHNKPTGFLGYCFVANQEGRSVSVVDLSRFRLRKQIPLDAAPSAVLVHPTKGKAFVLAPDSGTVYEIDGASLSLSRRARVGNRAAAMQFSPHNDALWVLCRDPAALVEIPVDSFRPARRVRLASPPDSFDVCETGLAAISTLQDHSIALVSLTGAAIERTIDAGVEPSLVRFQSDGKQLIAGSSPEHSIVIFDVPTGKIVVRLPVAIAPRHFCFDSTGGQLFVTGDGMDAVVIVFPYTTEVDQTMLAGHAPGSMATTVSTRESPPYLIVANPASDSLTVLDVDTRTLVAVVNVGRQPEHILITPDNQYALVLNEKSGDLAVVRIFSLNNTPSGTQRRFKTAPLFTLVPVGGKPVSAAVMGLA
jgi:YVTN family beta-propeller protein